MSNNQLLIPVLGKVEGTNYKNHLGLILVLLIYIAIAIVHSLVAPLTIGNDEWAHFLYARFIAEHSRLPINLDERQNKDEAGTKADDPPLYHLLVAAAANGIEPTRVLKADNGGPRRQLADNFVVSYAFLVHNAYESPPFQGEVQLWHIGRRLSILFGAVLIGLTYVTSLALFPRCYRRALVSAALLAFMPAFIFHNSVMTYDGLGAVFTALLLLACIRAVKQPARWIGWVLIGALAGLAVTTKYTSVLLPLEILFVGWLAFRSQPGLMRRALPRVVVAGLAMLLAASWWFGFTVWHFNTIEAKGPIVGLLEPLMVRGGNDSTAITVTSWLFGEEAVSTGTPGPRRERNLPQLAWTMAESFWSMPIAERFLLSPWLTLLVTAAALLSIIGLWRVWRNADSVARTWLLLLLFHTLLVMPLILMRVFISFDALEAVQGRHVLFPAASAIAILLVWGWAVWKPYRWGRKIAQIVVAGLLLWSVVGQVGWAALVYPGPLPVWAGKIPETELARIEPKNETPLDGMRLVGARWQESLTASSLEVSLWWKAQSLMLEDYLVELRLLDDANNPVSYSLGHPVQGRYPTRAWEPDDVIKDVHWLPLPRPLNGNYHLQLQLLNRAGQPVSEPVLLGDVSLATPPGESNPCAIWSMGQQNQGGLLAQPYRLRADFIVIAPERPRLVPASPSGSPEQWPLVSEGGIHTFIVGPDWEERYRLMVDLQMCGEIAISLQSRDWTAPKIPNPLVANFNNQVQLLGYELPARYIEPGGRLPLTLYWQALTYMGQDYQIFDNLLDDRQQRWGGYDRRAKDGYSTMLWAPGEIITDRFGVPVDPEAPNGIYTIDLGLYLKTESGAESLPLMADNQPTGQTSLRLGPIKVGGPPPDVVTTNPAPQIQINQSFGSQITLLGYDILNEQLSMHNDQFLKLKLYWQAETVPFTDYTTFLHLRNAANETVIQKDQPPAQGRYPTSLWGAGEVIVDEINLPLDDVAPGEYTPVIGLYNFETGIRLPVGDGPNTELPLSPVRIGE